jgi:hypothetical protein
MIRFIEMDENVTLADQLQKGGKDDRRSGIFETSSMSSPMMCVDFSRLEQQTHPTLSRT